MQQFTQDMPFRKRDAPSAQRHHAIRLPGFVAGDDGECGLHERPREMEHVLACRRRHQHRHVGATVLQRTDLLADVCLPDLLELQPGAGGDRLEHICADAAEAPIRIEVRQRCGVVAHGKADRGIALHPTPLGRGEFNPLGGSNGTATGPALEDLTGVAAAGGGQRRIQHGLELR
ncbi:hypothetical protein D3C81_413470 [compost metagenome]